MTYLLLEEAQLFRLITGLFGKDLVVHRMSVSTICGGALPVPFLDRDPALTSWSKLYKCLFTIIDPEGNPKLVIDFAPAVFGQTIDPLAIEFAKFLKPIFKASGINYISISEEEFSEILDPKGNCDFFSLLEEKLGLAEPEPV